MSIPLPRRLQLTSIDPFLRALPVRSLRGVRPLTAYHLRYLIRATIREVLEVRPRRYGPAVSVHGPILHRLQVNG